jgi:AcrR family transcriptional regulator
LDKKATGPTAEMARRPRADGQRNRERLIETAKTAFAAMGTDVSLEEVARRAGVGIGTLYRHFPTRDAIVEAVYRREVQTLADAATCLLRHHAPAAALRTWMLVFVDYIATKKIIAPALGSIAGGMPELYAASGARISGAMALLVQRAAAAGEIRGDCNPDDLLRALLGFTWGNADPGWEASARRLIDVLMDGLTAPPRAETSGHPSG